MNKMTAQEIISYLRSVELSINAIVSELGYEFDLTDEETEEIETKLGKYSVVYDYREGGDGDYDICVSIVHFVDHDCYIKFSGYYSSYNGSDYDEWSEVKPVTKTIVVYE